jgi:hypothetical protein
MAAPFPSVGSHQRLSVTEQAARNIYQLVDVSAAVRPDPAVMVITIWVEDRHPVAGRARFGDQPPRPFAGWLQLLGLLSDLIERQETSEATPAGLGGQADA